MAGKPYKSRLIPYQNEIAALRRRKPPMTYDQIAELLRQKYNLSIQGPAIFKFIKVRSRGRKMFSFGKDITVRKPASIPRLPAVQTSSRERKSFKDQVNRSNHEIEFQFTPSDRYNLTRLPTEVAASIRKKLEEEGH
jgi:hypothetical protein